MKQFYLLISLFFICFQSLSAQTFNTYYGTVVNNVSQTNILNDLTHFQSLGVKEIGTAALNNTQAWIKARYQSLGYTDIVEQPFSYSGSTTHNIIVTKTGTTYPNTYLIIDGHYDTINGPGANDNGSGTVLILELARLLKDVDTEYSIKFIHFSGEEDGLIGSNYYVDNTVAPNNLDISLVFNIDEVGGTAGQANDTIVCEEDRNNNPPQNNSASANATAELAACVELYSNINSEISYAYGSDYIPFEDNGEIITGLYEKDESPYAHTPNDIISNMDVNYLFEVTKASLGAALHFAVGVETLSVGNVENDNTFTVYPNPSNGLVTIKHTINTEVKLSLINILGKVVYTKTLNAKEETLNLSHLGQGVYISVLNTDKGSITKKIVLN